MSESKLVVDDRSLEQYFTETTFWRGLNYVEQGRVLSAEWDSAQLQLEGAVRGSGRRYVTSVWFGSTGSALEIVECSCSCPVGVDCKHAAALVLATSMPESAAESEGGGENSPWEPGIEALIPPGQGSEFAELGIQVVAARPKSPDAPVAVSLRPVGPGPTGWTAKSINWSNLGYTWQHGHRFDPEQLAVLGEILALYSAAHGYYGYNRESKITLDRYDSPRLWPLLDSARAAGIELVQGRIARHDLVAGPARYYLDIAQHAESGELSVRPRLQSELAGAVPVSFIGSNGHGVVFADARELAEHQRPDKCRLWLAPLKTPMPAAAQALLYEDRSLVIPAAGRTRFLADYLPRLRRSAAIASSDESFTPPAISGPEAVVSVGVRGDGGFDIRRLWSYRVDDEEHRVDPMSTDTGGHRDERAERVLTERLATALEPHGFESVARSSRPVRLTPLESLRFSTEVLPELADLPNVHVEFDGEPPDFRDVGESLAIEVSATESGNDTDWFDLGVSVTVEGREVSFLDLFQALCTDQTRMLLPDGAYFSLERPQLHSLRHLIEEARELTDAAPNALRISRFQAGLWEQLVEIGVVGQQAEAWRQQVAGLLEIESLDTPAPPDGLRAELRPYQLDGFAWLAFLWEHRLGGILADDMGLGKTVQTLALIRHAETRRPHGTPWLIVAPASVVANWAAESARFTPDLRVVTVADTFRRSGRSLTEVCADADIVVTSYTLMRLDIEEYTGQRWAGLILDEAQFVKNHQTKAYQCVRRLEREFTLAVTGTPMENNLMELWALLSITSPGLFPYPTRFRDYYAKPIEKGDAELLAQLRRRVRPLMRRRTKEQVAADLPAKQEQLLEVDLTPKHRKIYQTRLQRERQKVLGLIDDIDRNRLTILRSLTVLRQLSLHAGLVDADHDAVASAKIDALAEQLEDVIGGGHRALVFSQFTGFLSRVRARLDRDGIDYCYLDGRTRNRAAAIDRFRTGTAPVFLISLKAGGFGMNLTEADYCFLLDPWWNPATEAQAVDRTHRIGQTRNVMVYRLIARDTIEQKVMELKARKAALFAGVLDGGEGFGGALGAEDIRALFE